VNDAVDIERRHARFDRCAGNVEHFTAELSKAVMSG
jgi:hypothetical protein